MRKAVCQALALLASYHVAVLEPYFPQICVFMLTALTDSDEGVAMESCEFWMTLLDRPDTKHAMLPYLKDLVEHLINRLYLTNEQLEADRIEEEEQNSGEKELNLKPIHHRVGGGGGGGNGDGSAGNDDVSARWTLRKQAALLLDTVALSFPPNDILEVALPKIQHCFQHGADVRVRESGMLALGAISSGKLYNCNYNFTLTII